MFLNFKMFDYCTIYMQESLEVAVQCLETAFELTPEDATSLSVSKSLLDIFHDAVASEVSFIF